MGGLVLGLCLKKYAPDVHFDIYESATELGELGAGMTMSLRTWSMIKELGIVEELLPTTGTQAFAGMLLSIVMFVHTRSSDIWRVWCRFSSCLPEGRRGPRCRCVRAATVCV